MIMMMVEHPFPNATDQASEAQGGQVICPRSQNSLHKNINVVDPRNDIDVVGPNFSESFRKWFLLPFHERPRKTGVDADGYYCKLIS